MQQKIYLVPNISILLAFMRICNQAKHLQPSEPSLKTQRVFKLWTLAKEIFIKELAHASMARPFYSNCLGSEGLQTASYTDVRKSPSLQEVPHVFLLLQYHLRKALKSSPHS